MEDHSRGASHYIINMEKKGPDFPHYYDSVYCCYTWEQRLSHTAFLRRYESALSTKTFNNLYSKYFYSETEQNSSPLQKSSEGQFWRYNFDQNSNFGLLNLVKIQIFTLFHPLKINKLQINRFEQFSSSESHESQNVGPSKLGKHWNYDNQLQELSKCCVPLTFLTILRAYNSETKPFWPIRGQA